MNTRLAKADNDSSPSRNDPSHFPKLPERVAHATQARARESVWTTAEPCDK